MLNERKLTKTELDKREDIIMSMKKNKRNLVKKYGKDAEAVMYGRATNQAKNKTESMANNKLREMVKDALKNPKAADLNKDGKISDYEKARGSAIEKNIKEAGIEENEDNWADYTDIGQSYLEGFGKEHTLDDNQLEKLGKTIVKRLYKGDIGKAYDAVVNRDKLDIPGKPAFVKEDEDAEPTAAQLKKEPLSKIGYKLADTQKEMKQVVKKWSASEEGPAKDKLKDRLKELNKIKKELESLLESKK